MKRLVTMVVLLAACGTPATDPVAAPTGGATPVASSPAADGATVPAALDWSADRLGGGQIDGGDLAGRDVVLWFWAPW